MKMNLDQDFTEVCPLRHCWQLISNISDNGLEPNRLQAIIWTNDGLVYWHVYVCPSASVYKQI